MSALGHPLRIDLLDALAEREASPSELAKELNEPLGTVSYHVAVLRDAGLIAQTRTGLVRGALQHFYCASPEIGSWISAVRGLPVPDRPA